MRALPLFRLSVSAVLLLCSAEAGAQAPVAGATISGRTIDLRSGVSLGGVQIRIEGTDLQALSDSAGQYRIGAVPAGTQVIVAQRLGYAVTRVPVTVPHEGVVERDLALAETALAVRGITVTADPAGRARGELGTASVIAAEAIRHQTATSLAGVLELIPGVELTPPGLDAVQQVALRTAPTSGSGGIGVNDVASFGTLIILDGVPVSNNANLQAAGALGGTSFTGSVVGGLDLRRIPAATLERVEVIRGVPSARYGDLTQGVVVVDTRAGAFAPELSAEFDPRTGEGIVAGGRNLGPRQVGTLNLDVARTRSAPGLTDDTKLRLAAQAAHHARLGGGEGSGGRERLALDTRLDFFRLMDDRPEDPEVQPGVSFSTRETGLRVSERARLHLSDGLALALTASYERLDQRRVQRRTPDRPAMPVTNRLTEGRSIGRFLEGRYESVLRVDGAPRIFYGRLELEGRREFLGFDHRLRGGAELRREWNDAAGLQFEVEFPPYISFDGLQGYSRPGPYDDPPVATSAFYLDNRLTRNLGAGSVLNLQAGLRLDVLHRAAWWASAGRSSLLQPRLTAELLPRPWLRLRAGWGRTAKTPALAHLFPDPSYYDVINVNWYSVHPAERLAVLTTYILDPTNSDLGLTTATKREAGVELAVGGSVVSVVAFDDGVEGAVAPRPKPGFLLRHRFQLSDSTIGTGRQPRIVEPSYAADTIPVLLLRPENHVRQTSHGLEVTAVLPELAALRTRLQLQGAWIRSEQTSEALSFGSAGGFAEFQLLENRQRSPYWKGLLERGERALMTYRLVHHQPEMGLVMTAIVQHNIRNVIEDIGGTDTLSFDGYMTRAGTLVPVPASERDRLEYRDLRRSRSGALRAPAATPPDWLMSLQVSKALPLGGQLRFWGFNLLDNPGRLPDPGQRPRVYQGLRFGLELTLPAAALMAWR